MNGITTEVNHYLVDGRIICVSTIYKDGAFLCDSRLDVTDQVNKLQDNKNKKI
jgi:hypothetical protein